MKSFEIDRTTFVKDYRKQSNIGLIVSAALWVAVLAVFAVRLTV